MTTHPPGKAELQLDPDDVPEAGRVGTRRSQDRRSRGPWYSRGYLPHFDGRSVIQSITFRLVDSLPQEKLRQLESELADFPDDQQSVERRRRIESWLDAGMGCCALLHTAAAAIVQDALLHDAGDRYQLIAWCIMPNHVHVMIEPTAELGKIVQSWKSYTGRWIRAHAAQLELGVPGDGFWMREYWDRYIRDEQHFQRAVAYLHQNPVAAGLCAKPEEWRWSSAFPGNAGLQLGKNAIDAELELGAPRHNP